MPRRLHLGDRRRDRLLILGLAACLFLLTAGLSFAVTGQMLLQQQLAGKEREIGRLAEQAERERASLGATIADLEAASDSQRATLARLGDLHGAMRAELSFVEARLADLAAERDSALELAGSLGRAVRDAEARLRSAVREKAALAARLASSETRLAALAGEREDERRLATGLRWRAEVLEAQIEGLRQAHHSQSAWFRGWVGGQAGAIETLLAGSGIEVEPLLARAVDENAYGQGGPFEALAEEGAGVLRLASFEARVEEDLARMVAMQRLVAALPLATPMDEFYVTSTFGPRPDPITRRQALHAGIDMGAPAGTPILATAPGRVLRAGRLGPYGIMVEIDHGLGITTRYAHLREALVEEGAVVDFRDQLGTIGSTGRATGRHLHYEIRIDDEPLDPTRFLDAGRQLTLVFRG